MSRYTYGEIIQHRKTWQAYLTDGSYLQGRGSLVQKSEADPECGCSTISYCCLGVAYDVAGMNLPTPVYNIDFSFFSDNLGARYTSTFNDEMIEYMGFTMWMVDILINLNDNGVNFSQIEETIEMFPVVIDGVYHEPY